MRTGLFRYLGRRQDRQAARSSGFPGTPVAVPFGDLTPFEKGQQRPLGIVRGLALRPARASRHLTCLLCGRALRHETVAFQGLGPPALGLSRGSSGSVLPSLPGRVVQNEGELQRQRGAHDLLEGGPEGGFQLVAEVQ